MKTGWSVTLLLAAPVGGGLQHWILDRMLIRRFDPQWAVFDAGPSLEG